MRPFLSACLVIFMFMHLATIMVEAQDRGALTVTATVVTSVAMVTDENGKPRIVVANPADRNDNVSYVSYVRSSSSVNAELVKKSYSAGVHETTAKRKSAILR
jgi:hypothetical protein